jgi:hypothetical protein
VGCFDDFAQSDSSKNKLFSDDGDLSVVLVVRDSRSLVARGRCYGRIGGSGETLKGWDAELLVGRLLLVGNYLKEVQTEVYASARSSSCSQRGEKSKWIPGDAVLAHGRCRRIVIRWDRVIPRRLTLDDAC